MLRKRAVWWALAGAIALGSGIAVAVPPGSTAAAAGPRAGAAWTKTVKTTWKWSLNGSSSCPVTQVIWSGGHKVVKCVHPQKWPHGRITYHNTMPGRSRAVRLAVRAWNRSGTHVRFVPTSRSRARVLITPTESTGGRFGMGSCNDFTGKPAGCATLGYISNGSNHVWLRASTWKAGRKYDARTWVDVAAHELGHVIGLEHDHRHCATMDTALFEECNTKFERSSAACRPLQPNDVRRAVHMYGGHARASKKLGFCVRIAPPHDVKARIAKRGRRDTRFAIRWRDDSPDAPTVMVGIIPSACPSTPPRLHDANLIKLLSFPSRAHHVNTATVKGVPLFAAGGHVCVALWSRDTYGRQSRKPAMTTVAVPGRHQAKGSPTPVVVVVGA